MKDDLHIITTALEEITDPEIPVVTIQEMGILRSVHQDEGGTFVVTITPTYSGCPAMDMIASLISWKMVEIGYDDFRVHHQITPAWTTDWMTDGARKKLEDYGIAPPDPDRRRNQPVKCPQCKSTEVVELSRFGSTACKSLWQCTTCKEPFDYFKCH